VLVLGWHRSEREERHLPLPVAEVVERLTRVGQPSMRPWRYRRGNAAVWWTRRGQSFTFRPSTEQVGASGIDYLRMRPVLRVVLQDEPRGTLTQLQYRSALGPLALRTLSLGLFDLFIARAEDDAQWAAVRRSLEQSVEAALRAW
jgi:hypothetical protein